jgi:hypothetical protein
MKDEYRQTFGSSNARLRGDIYNLISPRSTEPLPTNDGGLFVLVELHFPDLYHPMGRILWEALAPWCDELYHERETEVDEEHWSYSSKLGEGHAIHRFSSFEKTLSFLATHNFHMFDPTYLTWRGGGPFALQGYERMPMFLDLRGTIWALTAFTIKSVYPIFENNIYDNKSLITALIETNYQGNLQYCQDWLPVHSFNSSMTLPDKRHKNEARLRTHIYLENILLWYYNVDVPAIYSKRNFYFKTGMRWIYEEKKPERTCYTNGPNTIL